jgi:hypothetical protein
MKKTFTTILILSFTLFVQAFGQQTISDMTASAKEGTKELGMIYDLDVFRYFRLKDYDTELKKSLFKKTEEYQNYLKQLKEMKADMFKTTYYIKPYEEFGDYDIQRKGFELNLGLMGANSATAPKSFELPARKKENEDEGEDDVEFSYSLHVQFNALPTTQSTSVYVNRVGYGGNRYKLFIPLSEVNGLEIENDKDNIDLYFFFVPSASGIFLHHWQCYEGHRNSRIMKTDKVRIVVANKSSGKIYYNKSFSYQPTTQKK